jgi:hypothetical protein
MASKSVKIELDIGDRDAKRKLQEVAKEVGDLDTAFGDGESAGQAMARAIEQSAADMIDEIDATKRAVDALESKLTGLDVDPRQVVADLKAIGLTAQDIEADADDLAAALRKADDVKLHAAKQGFDDLDQALGRTTDNSKVTSTAIGGIGNSLTELPGVGSLGPVAESMGMLAENALEGEANLKGLVVAGGGLAAVGLAVQLVGKHFAEIAEIKAWNTEQIDGWTESIYEAESALAGLTESYRQAGTIEVETPFDGIKDVTSDLARANITVDDWTRAVQGGSRAQDEIGRKLQAAGLSGKQVVDVLVGLKFAQDNYITATKEAADRTAVFGSATDAAAADVGDLNAELDRVPGTRVAEIGVDTSAANAGLAKLEARLQAWANSTTSIFNNTITNNYPAGVRAPDVVNANRQDRRIQGPRT